MVSYGGKSCLVKDDVINNFKLTYSVRWRVRGKIALKWQPFCDKVQMSPDKISVLVHDKINRCFICVTYFPLEHY